MEQLTKDSINKLDELIIAQKRIRYMPYRISTQDINNIFDGETNIDNDIDLQKDIIEYCEDLGYDITYFEDGILYLDSCSG